MKDAIELRTCDLAQYIIKHRATVRAAAAQFGISKSTVHKDVRERLKQIDPDLYAHVSLVLSYNKAVRHLRGGEATRRKYRFR
ncbi:MAG: sporulation transcriptional regulator SpoIIID [Clostridia bacterium]|nr:sporulation transcriptional regulator SpoIIID [Clostridia bacterium]